MAKVDTTAVLIDPDFSDTFTRIQRTVTVNEYGEAVYAETSVTLLGVVQNDQTERLEGLPEGARLSDAISVYYRGELIPERSGGYADVIEWNGKRYVVREVTENYQNWGAGWTKAICTMEEVNNG